MEREQDVEAQEIEGVSKEKKPSFTDFVDMGDIKDRCVLSGDSTVAIIRNLKREPDDLHSFELMNGHTKKRELELKAQEIATILEERHGYTVNREKLANTVWHMRKAGFTNDGDVTVYFFEEAQPLIVRCGFNWAGGFYAIVAPKILDYPEVI